eukprot:scaffold4607_cov39-Cyclotella_meneghiniana.AAC.8
MDVQQGLACDYSKGVDPSSNEGKIASLRARLEQEFTLSDSRKQIRNLICLQASSFIWQRNALKLKSLEAADFIANFDSWDDPTEGCRAK